MKKNGLVLYLMAVTGIALSLNACNNEPSTTNASGGGSYSSIHLPKDVLPTCTVPPDTFKTWFKDSTVKENGLVTPANSVTFAHSNNCDFYQWSERMFLWITSQNTGQYGSGGTVMESPVFYTVSPDSAKQRQLIKHTPGQIIRATGSLLKNGPDRLPLFKDKKGHLFQVIVHTAGEKPLVKNQLGSTVEVSSVEKDATGKAIFKDKTGKKIENPKLITTLPHPEKILQEFPTAKGPVFLDANGNQVDAEQAQATGDVLMAQNGSLVYYITMVNDMYAYFLTAVKNGYMAGTQFPTTASARDSILAYAHMQGYTMPTDPNALAIEIKTSWVIADSLTDQNNYVTMDAIVPTYNTSSNTIWVPNGEKKVKLALTGIHVVGSVAGHPEMVWATFEHKSNSPNAAYQYINNNKQVQTVPADTGTHWLFNNNASAPPSTFDSSHMQAQGDSIVAVPPYTISPSNTNIAFPWGTALHNVPNQEDTSASASNTEILSLNNAILGMLPGNDVRKNYLLIGATWTFGGAAPNGAIYPVDSTSGGAIGTSLLANSTMETYFQSDSTTCFTCHQTLTPTRLSHVFKALQPLSATQKAIKDKK